MDEGARRAPNGVPRCCLSSLSIFASTQQSIDLSIPSARFPASMPLSSPLQLGDAVLNQMLATLVLIAEHVVPSLHKFLSWEVEDPDLGPILPVRCSIVRSRVYFYGLC